VTRSLRVVPILLLASTGCVVWPAGSGPSAPPIAAGDALAMVESQQAVWVDVRPREAYEAGHIPGALHVDALDVDERAAELRRLGRLPILYCG
jgi:rhodanese-related sulfurtransferase